MKELIDMVKVYRPSTMCDSCSVQRLTPDETTPNANIHHGIRLVHWLMYFNNQRETLRHHNHIHRGELAATTTAYNISGSSFPEICHKTGTFIEIIRKHHVRCSLTVQVLNLPGTLIKYTKTDFRENRKWCVARSGWAAIFGGTAPKRQLVQYYSQKKTSTYNLRQVHK